jgi:anti-sigma factor RsiW
MLHLTENDPRLQDYIDGGLPAAERSALEQHLAGCPECALLCRAYQRLDRQLASHIHRPLLSPGFHARLLHQIEHTGLGGTLAAQKRQQLESDIKAEWQAHRRNFWRALLPGFLDGLGYSGAAAVAGSLLFRLINAFLQASGAATTAHAQQLALALGATVGAAILLASLAFVTKTHLSRWLA